MTEGGDGCKYWKGKHLSTEHKKLFVLVEEFLGIKTKKQHQKWLKKSPKSYWFAWFNDWKTPFQKSKNEYEQTSKR